MLLNFLIWKNLSINLTLTHEALWIMKTLFALIEFKRNIRTDVFIY